eukprot:2970480-Rhodomonas_salina.1
MLGTSGLFVQTLNSAVLGTYWGLLDQPLTRAEGLSDTDMDCSGDAVSQRQRGGEALARDLDEVPPYHQRGPQPG